MVNWKVQRWPINMVNSSTRVGARDEVKYIAPFWGRGYELALFWGKKSLSGWRNLTEEGEEEELTRPYRMESPEMQVQS